MGAITGMLGLGGEAGGTGFGGPQVRPTDVQGMQNLQDVYQRLGAVASGEGPNVAQAEYLKNIQDLSKQQAGAISSIQGISPALAARLISQQQSGAMQQTAAQSAANRAAQQMQALGQMGGVAGTQAQTAAGMQQNVNQVNAALAQQMMQNQQKFIGGLQNAAGAALGLADGGMVPSPSEGPRSTIGRALMAAGGPVHDYRQGGHVQAAAPEQKAVKAGDSFANDKVPAMLSEGEVVIPRSVMQSPNPERSAADFVRAVMAKRMGKK